MTEQEIKQTREDYFLKADIIQFINNSVLNNYSENGLLDEYTDDWDEYNHKFDAHFLTDEENCHIITTCIYPIYKTKDGYNSTKTGITLFAFDSEIKDGLVVTKERCVYD
jgi:hypothetical protein